MANTFFRFKQFTIQQDKTPMKVTTDACLFGSWVAQRISGLKKESITILDMGTGTGLLSLMVAQQNKNCHIEAVEVEEMAASQANENVRASPWQDLITVKCEDIREYKAENKFDIIISNPPFYENELKSNDSGKNLAHHGEGLQLREVPEILKKLLKKNGRFYLLLPFKRNEELKNLFLAHRLVIEEMTFVRQSVKHNFFRIMVSGSLQEKGNKKGTSETSLEELVIKDQKDDYTPDFTRLLKDYYLYL